MKPGIFGFGKKEYSVPRINAVPERKPEDQTGCYVNESERAIVVKIFDTGSGDFIATAIGALEIAKDVVKSTISNWHERERRQSAIIRPASPPNSHA